jgi:hypothetical protein
VHRLQEGRLCVHQTAGRQHTNNFRNNILRPIDVLENRLHPDGMNGVIGKRNAMPVGDKGRVDARIDVEGHDFDVSGCSKRVEALANRGTPDDQDPRSAKLAN